MKYCSCWTTSKVVLFASTKTPSQATVQPSKAIWMISNRKFNDANSRALFREALIPPDHLSFSAILLFSFEFVTKKMKSRMGGKYEYILFMHSDSRTRRTHTHAHHIRCLIVHTKERNAHYYQK